MELSGAGRNESVARAFAVMAAISEGQGAGVSTRDITQVTGLPRSTVLRTLGSLLDEGAVVRERDRTWLIGPMLERLSRAGSPLLRVRDETRRILRTLTLATSETSMLAIAAGNTSARILDEVESPNLLSVRSRWAGRVIDHSASGFVRTLLAEMTDEEARDHLRRMEHPQRTRFTKTSVEDLLAAVRVIREQQHSAVINELEEGIAGVGMAVRHQGTLIGQLAVYLPSSRLSAEKHQMILDEMHRAAAAISDLVDVPGSA